MHLLLDSFVEKNLLTLKYEGVENRNRRSGTMVKFLIGISYYTIMGTLGYYLLYNSSVLPYWMGGNGKCISMMTRAPREPDASALAEIYICASFGKHFARLLLHTFVTSEGNYYSFTLHHIVSIFLIFEAYCLNFWALGMLVLVLHDVGDLMNSIVRFYIVTFEINLGT